MTKRILQNFLLLLAALAVLTSPALAQGNSNGHGNGNSHGNGHRNGNGKGHGNKHKGNRVEREREVTVFGTRDRDLISGYFRDNYANLPPGLAKRGGNLPPGLERQLRRNGTLPPGLQKRMQPFPPELESQLPPLPPYYSRGVIGASVVIYNNRTRLIVDVIHNIF